MSDFNDLSTTKLKNLKTQETTDKLKTQFETKQLRDQIFQQAPQATPKAFPDFNKPLMSATSMKKINNIFDERQENQEKAKKTKLISMATTYFNVFSMKYPSLKKIPQPTTKSSLEEWTNYLEELKVGVRSATALPNLISYWTSLVGGAAFFSQSFPQFAFNPYTQSPINPVVFNVLSSPDFLKESEDEMLELSILYRDYLVMGPIKTLLKRSITKVLEADAMLHAQKQSHVPTPSPDQPDTNIGDIVPPALPKKKKPTIRTKK